MRSSEEVYLTDEQYLDLLRNGLDNLESIGTVSMVDSNTIGDKYTETNVGLCNPELTTEDTALFPDRWPCKKTRKYRRPHHHCPFDWREVSQEWKDGCFYTCMVFHQNLRDVGLMKQLYGLHIKRMEEVMKNNCDQCGNSDTVHHLCADCSQEACVMVERLMDENKRLTALLFETSQAGMSVFEELVAKFVNKVRAVDWGKLKALLESIKR